MDKKELFKNFIGAHPEILKYIKNKEMTFQDFFEIYDIYGEVIRRKVGKTGKK